MVQLVPHKQARWAGVNTRLTAQISQSNMEDFEKVIEKVYYAELMSKEPPYHLYLTILARIVRCTLIAARKMHQTSSR